MYRRQPSAALPLSTRAVVASEPDVLVTHLAIRRAGDYDSIRRPVVHDGLERFHTSRRGRAQCMPHVLLHEARPERRAVGVTRLNPDDIFLYFNLALSSHCWFFRASVRLARSLLEHPQLRERRRAGHSLHVAGRCTCVLWAVTNIELVRHDGRVRQQAGGQHVARADPLCVRQEGLATCWRFLAVPTKTIKRAKVHLQSLCLAGALACRNTRLSVSTMCSCIICT